MAFHLFSTNDVTTEYSAINPFTLNLNRQEFITLMTQDLFERLLARCQSRTIGLTDEQTQALYNNVDRGSASRGLYSILAEAMANNNSICLVYKQGVLRRATIDEANQIQDDYQKKAKSALGVYVDFSSYSKTKIVKFYMGLIYRVFQTAEVNLGLSRSILFKMANMRKSVSVPASSAILEQAHNITQGLSQGKSAIVDADDMLEISDLKGESIERMLQLIYSELASKLDLPVSFVSGVLASGMSATGDADLNNTDEGLKYTFYSVYKPVLEQLFKVTISYRSENWRSFEAKVQLLPQVESSLYLTDDQKKAFVDSIFTED